MKKDKGLVLILALIVLVAGIQLAQKMKSSDKKDTKHLDLKKSIEVTKTEYYQDINDDEVPKTIETSEEQEGIIYSGTLELRSKSYENSNNSWKAIYEGKLYYDKELNGDIGKGK